MRKRNYWGLLLLLLIVPLAMQAGETFNVKKYGARGNGKKMEGSLYHFKSNW